MTPFWIPDLGAHILLVVRSTSSRNVRSITRALNKRLREEDMHGKRLVEDFQKLPTENHVWAVLQDLVATKKLLKRVSEASGNIEYVTPYQSQWLGEKKKSGR